MSKRDGVAVCLRKSMTTGIYDRQQIERFLQSTDEELIKRKQKLTSKYNFDFDAEAPIPQPNPSIKYVSVPENQVPSFYQTKILKEELPQDMAINFDKKKQVSYMEQNHDYRASVLSTSPSTVVGERQSTQGYEHLLTDRYRNSTLPTLDRIEEEDETPILIPSLQCSYKSTFIEQETSIRSSVMEDKNKQNNLKLALIQQIQMKQKMTLESQPNITKLPSVNKAPLFNNKVALTQRNQELGKQMPRVKGNSLAQLQNNDKHSRNFATTQKYQVQSSHTLQQMNQSTKDLFSESRIPAINSMDKLGRASSKPKKGYHIRKAKSNEKLDINLSQKMQNLSISQASSSAKKPSESNSQKYLSLQSSSPNPQNKQSSSKQFKKIMNKIYPNIDRKVLRNQPNQTFSLKNKYRSQNRKDQDSNDHLQEPQSADQLSRNMKKQRGHFTLTYEEKKVQNIEEHEPIITQINKEAVANKVPTTNLKSVLKPESENLTPRKIQYEKLNEKKDEHI